MTISRITTPHSLWEFRARPGFGYSRHVSSPSVATLDERFAEGSVELRAVYDEFSRLIYSIARRALSPEAAHEVTQDVFVRAWKAREQFDRSRGTLKAWLVGITKKRIIDHLRSERRHADRRASEDAAPLATEATEIDAIADKTMLADALKHLPERARTAIVLAYIDDLTHQQIADKTGVPLGTVKSDIRRGLETIRTQMAREEVAS